MKTPTQAMAANLLWTRSGVVWASWVLQGLPYGLRPEKDKQLARAMHQALFRSLPGESLLLGLRSALDPSVIVSRMLDGVDPDENPEWVAECDATWGWLNEVGPGQRVFFLSVPLGADKAFDGVMEPLRAAKADLWDTLGLPRSTVPTDEVRRRMAQAARVAEGIPGVFRPVPATPAQMVWVHEHSRRRGLSEDADLPEVGEERLAADLLAAKGASALGTPVLDEGGQGDFDPRSLARLNPVGRKYLKVTSAHTPAEDEAASYQRLMVISDVPDSGVVFPGCELLGRIDESSADVDWAIRLTVRSSREVTARNRRAVRELDEQYNQREGESGFGLNGLDHAARDLAEYAEILDSDQLEVETQATIIFAVGGDTPDEVRLQGRIVTDFLAATGYKLATPLGMQTDLWWDMHPGSPASSAVREFAQITTSRTLSALVPLASVRLGDTKGSALGLNIGHGPLLGENHPCGPTSVVLHDLEGASDRQVSGSMAVAGDLGAGKTTLLMKLAGDTVDRGGQVVIADKSDKGEWVDWAEGLTRAVVVDHTSPIWSLDPLRIFDPAAASRIMQSFLTPLLNVPATSAKGVLLSQVLKRAYLDEHGIGSAGELLRHLQDDCALPGAQELAGLIGVFAGQDLGRVIFDGTIPPLDLSTRAVVIRTHKLELPDREELENAHQFEQMGLEKIFARAYHALIATIARQVCFADTSTLAGFFASEAHALTISPEGERVLVLFVREGRKARAFAALDSHDPLADFGSKTLRGLIPIRIQMRQPDKELAKNGLKWLDLDPSDDALVELITTDTSPKGNDGTPSYRRGEGLMRDASANIGRIKVQLPARPERAAAISAGGSAAPRAAAKRLSPA